MSNKAYEIFMLVGFEKDTIQLYGKAQQLKEKVKVRVYNMPSDLVIA